MLYNFDMTSFKKDSKEPDPIMLSDIRFITTQLVDFLNFYKTNFVIQTKEDQQILDELTAYAELLSNERYDKLFKDTSLIKKDTFD